MSVKTILIAHRSAPLRDRLASALAHARHETVVAGSAAEASAALGGATTVDLALIDLGLAADAIGFVRDLGTRAAAALPIVVFAGSVSSAGQIAELAAQGVAGYLNEHASPEQVLQALAPHLFPHNFNRRASARLEAGLAVAVRTEQGIVSATTRDLSRGGMAIRTMSPLPVGTAIHVTFRVPGGATDIEARGQVVWSDRRVGMGIQFERLPAEAQQGLDRFVDEPL